MAQTVAYIQEHGYDTRADFNAALTNAESQTSLARKKMKDTEQQLKNVNEQIHFTGQYLAYKDLYAQYRKSRNRNKFYEEHKAELSLYETALRVLKEKSNGQKLPSMKSLYAEKDRLTELREVQRSDFFSHRDQERELRTVDANIDMILGKKPAQEHHLFQMKSKSLERRDFAPFSEYICIFWSEIKNRTYHSLSIFLSCHLDLLLSPLHFELNTQLQFLPYLPVYSKIL